MNEANKKPHAEKRLSLASATTLLSLIHEFYIDFLGSLVPGLFTTIVGVTVVAWAFLVVCNTIQNILNQTSLSLITLRDLMADLHWEIFIVIAVTSYIIGSIFFRRDPKVPDALSAKHIWKVSSDEERKNLAVQEATDDRGRVYFDCQFPYLFIAEYLEARGLKHLASMVPWKGSDRKTHSLRSKMFINILKVRLHFVVPDKCSDIIRNEAHIRLATSVWFASAWLIKISLFALFLVVVSAVALFIHAYRSSVDFVYGCTLVPPETSLAFLVIVVVILVALVMQSEIQKFIHYMRVREIVYVLESAYFTEIQCKKLNVEAMVEEMTQCVSAADK